MCIRSPEGKLRDSSVEHHLSKHEQDPLPSQLQALSVVHNFVTKKRAGQRERTVWRCCTYLEVWHPTVHFGRASSVAASCRYKFKRTTKKPLAKEIFSPTSKQLCRFDNVFEVELIEFSDNRKSVKRSPGTNTPVVFIHAVMFRLWRVLFILSLTKNKQFTSLLWKYFLSDAYYMYRYGTTGTVA